MQTQIIEQIRQLPISERKNLVEEIQTSIEEDTVMKLRSSLPTEKERWPFIIATAQLIWGVNNLKSESRTENHSWARSFAVSQLTKEGCPINEISRLVNRDRTTIIHMRKKISELEKNPSFDRKTYQKYKQFKELI